MTVEDTNSAAISTPSSSTKTITEEEEVEERNILITPSLEHTMGHSPEHSVEHSSESSSNNYGGERSLVNSENDVLSLSASSDALPSEGTEANAPKLTKLFPVKINLLILCFTFFLSLNFINDLDFLYYTIFLCKDQFRILLQGKNELTLIQMLRLTGNITNVLCV